MGNVESFIVSWGSSYGTAISMPSTENSELGIFSFPFHWMMMMFIVFKCVCCSVAQSCPTLWSHRSYHARLLCPSLSPRVCSNSCPLSQWCYLTIFSSAALFSFCLQSFPGSGSFPVCQLFPIRWSKYWSFSINPSNEYSGLISFRIDWFNFLAVQGTLKGLLQHHILKASVLQHSAFLMLQLSHLNMTTGKTRALTIWRLVSKVMSLLFNKLSRFVIGFLPRSTCLLISWLQSPFTVILEPRRIKSVTVSIFFSFYLP